MNHPARALHASDRRQDLQHTSDQRETSLNKHYANMMAGWTIAVCVLGSFLATVSAVLAGVEPGEYIQVWLSWWWGWVPVGLLTGFAVARSKRSTRH
jgi:FtsH-binding integral membrane protein